MMLALTPMLWLGQIRLYLSVQNLIARLIGEEIQKLFMLTPNNPTTQRLGFSRYSMGWQSNIPVFPSVCASARQRSMFNAQKDNVQWSMRNE